MAHSPHRRQISEGASAKGTRNVSTCRPRNWCPCFSLASALRPPRFLLLCVRVVELWEKLRLHSHKTTPQKGVHSLQEHIRSPHRSNKLIREGVEFTGKKDEVLQGIDAASFKESCPIRGPKSVSPLIICRSRVTRT